MWMLKDFDHQYIVEDFYHQYVVEDFHHQYMVEDFHHQCMVEDVIFTWRPGTLADFLHRMWNIGKSRVMIKWSSRWKRLSSTQATTTISDHPSALYLLIQVQAKTLCHGASCKCKHMVCNKQVKLGEDDWVARKWQQFLGTISYPRTNYHCQDNSQLTATVSYHCRTNYRIPANYSST